MSENKVVRVKDLYPLVGLKPARILALVKEGKFPKPFTITEGGRVYVWLASEIDAWIEERSKTGRAA